MNIMGELEEFKNTLKVLGANQNKMYKLLQQILVKIEKK